MYRSISKDNFLNKNTVQIFIITLIVLLGYYKVFVGGNFFVYEDHVTVSGYSYGNSLGNGWRPDKGLGISFFFGDPSMWHPWGLFSLWEQIAPSRIFAYNASVVLFDIFAAISMYIFLKRVLPEGSGLTSCLLSPLAVFCLQQVSNHYQRHWITLMIGTPLFLILLYDYYKRPRIIHVFQAAFLFWFVIFLGNLASFMNFLSIGVLFSFVYYSYFRGSFKKFIYNGALLFSAACFVTFLLGAWTFYSFFLELSIVGYMREKVIAFPQIDLIPDLWNVIEFFLSLIQAEFLSAEIWLAGIPWRPLRHSWNVLIISSLVRIFYIFRRRHANFWEYSFKWLLVVIIAHGALGAFIPVYGQFFNYIGEKSSRLLTIPNYRCISLFPLDIGLIGMFIFEIKKKNFMVRNKWGSLIQKGAASLIFIFFSGMVVFCIFAMFFPEVLPAAIRYCIRQFFPESVGQYSREFLTTVGPFNLSRLQKAMHWQSLIFYLLSALLPLPFIINKLFLKISERPAALIAGILLIYGIFLSWTLYPLSEKKIIWEQSADHLPQFNPTDRFYYVKNDFSEMQKEGDITERFKKVFVDIDGEGPREYFFGYNESPALTFSGLKSFSQKNVGAFVYNMFNQKGTNRIKELRDAVYGPRMSNELMDMSAFKYYYTSREFLRVPEYLSLYVKAKELYIYKNLNAWPYFYLADSMEIKDEGKHLEDVQRGTAYVSEKDVFTIEQAKNRSGIKLKEFSYGRMVFEYEGNSENFLVVADAWHPFWRADIGERELSVVMANEVFKGVKLPPGKFDLTLYFDTSPYYPGIYISVAAWVLFLSGWIFIHRLHRFSQIKIFF